MYNIIIIKSHMYIWLLPISPDKKLFVGLMGMYQNIYTQNFKMGEYFSNNKKLS